MILVRVFPAFFYGIAITDHVRCVRICTCIYNYTYMQYISYMDI
jgi:hypothetical protein